MHLSDLRNQLVDDPRNFFFVIKQLISAKTEYYNTLIILESSHKDLENEIIRGTLSKEDIDTRKNRFRERTLAFIVELEEEGVIQPIIPKGEVILEEGDIEKRLKRYKSDKILHSHEGGGIARKELLSLIRAVKAELIRYCRLSDCDLDSNVRDTNDISINSTFKVEEVSLRISSCVGVYRKAQITVEKREESDIEDSKPNKIRYLYDLFYLGYDYNNQLCWWPESEVHQGNGFKTKELAKYLAMTVFDLVLKKDGY